VISTVFGLAFAERRFVRSLDELAVRLTHALALDRPSLIVVPVDYSLDVSIADEFGEEIAPT
jgi:hypothetical protein